MNFINNGIRKVEDKEDGSALFEIFPADFEAEDQNIAAPENLAEDFSESELQKLSTYLLEAIEEDIAARKPRRDIINKAEKYLGFTIEDIDEQSFKYATRTYDSTVANALMQNISKILSELLSAGNLFVDYKTNNTEPTLIHKAEKVKAWFNYYLRKIDRPYRSDFEKCILYDIWEGSSYKKVYYDTILQRPKSRFILPEHFIVDSDCTSILESERLTHVIYLSKREILLKQQTGIFLDIDLPYLKSLQNDDEIDDNEEEINNKLKKTSGIDISAYTKRSLFPLYEVHTYLNLDEYRRNNTNADSEKSIPLPYIVTIDKTTKKILSIYSNGNSSKQRKEYFVQYNYITGFGNEGLGLAQLLGSNAMTLTRLRRSLTDAGLFSNLPGGIKVKGLKNQNPEIIIGPGQWAELDTGGVPLRDSIMNLPYRGGDPTLKELMVDIMNQTKELGSISELGMLDSKEDIPASTILAALEVHNRIQSAVFRSIHDSFSQELQLLFNLFKETIETEKFYVNEEEVEITADDFDERIQIVPAADPATNSSILRLIRSETVLRTAMEMPELHNIQNVLIRYYRDLGIDDEGIREILLSEEQLAERASAQQQTPAIDPNAVLMADIQQKQAETEARERMENQKLEASTFKTQMDFEKEKAKIESNEKIAELKAATELTKKEDKLSDLY